MLEADGGMTSKRVLALLVEDRRRVESLEKQLACLRNEMQRMQESDVEMQQTP